MSHSDEHPSTWIYEGIWGLLAGVFCVPRDAPKLPTIDAEAISSRKPSPKYISYLMFPLGLALAAFAIPSITVSIILAITENAWFLMATVAVVLFLGFVCVIGILAIHLRYDTMWYVFSDRSMRLRRGIWVIRESTITFENIQNVKVIQGPLQRWFGIADVVVETAGGGGSHAQQGGGLGMHSGVIEGVADASAIRDSIMDHVRNVSTAGLGDELLDPTTARRSWPASHIDVLREIRDLAKRTAT